MPWFFIARERSILLTGSQFLLKKYLEQRNFHKLFNTLWTLALDGGGEVYWVGAVILFDSLRCCWDGLLFVRSIEFTSVGRGNIGSISFFGRAIKTLAFTM